MTGRDWKANAHAGRQPAPDEMFECVRQRRTIVRELTLVYDELAETFAREVQEALPNVAPELIAVVAMNFLGRITGVGYQISRFEGGGLDHGINIAALAALRLWDGQK